MRVHGFCTNGRPRSLEIVCDRLVDARVILSVISSDPFYIVIYYIKVILYSKLRCKLGQDYLDIQ